MPISQSVLDSLKQNGPTLTELNLSQQNLVDQDIQALMQALTDNTPLVRLNLFNNHISDEGSKILAQNTSLIYLDLACNQIGDEGAKALAKNTCLIKLNLSNNRIGPAGVSDLAQNTSLIHLDLAHNKIGTEGAKALAQNTSLTHLNLANNKIGTEGARALAQNTSLRYLDLYFNEIYDGGAQALAQNRLLTTLHLDNNHISDKGAKALAQNSQFIYLNLLNNRHITDKGAAALMRGTSLIKLNLGGNRISTEYTKMVEQAIKQNQIQLIQRRDQFIQAMIILGRDISNPHSQSYWSKLPKELMLYVISCMDFLPPKSIGKTKKQIYQCAEFIFNHIPQLNESLTASINTKQKFKIVEKIRHGKSQFRFFPPKIEEKNRPEDELTYSENKNCLIM